MKNFYFFRRGSSVLAGALWMMAFVIPGAGLVAEDVKAPAVDTAPKAVEKAAAVPTEDVRPSGLVTQVVLTKETQGEERQPVSATDVFTPQSVIHAVVHIENAPENSKFKASWYAIDVGSVAPPNTLIDGYELTTNGSGNIDFTLTPKSSWPPGTYRVVISVNGVVDTVKTYSVK